MDGEAQPGVATSVFDGRELKQDERIVAADRVGHLVRSSLFAVVTLGGLAAALRALDLPEPFTVPAYLFWIGLVLLRLLLALVWPRIGWRHTWYSADSRGLVIRRGVLWRTVTTVPHNRVQHTDVTAGPIQRRFGLATLVVHTAGVSHATVTLDGLEQQCAERLRDFLISGEGDDAV